MNMDRQLRNFYHQYLQQVAFERLSFPGSKILLRPDIQSQAFTFFFQNAPTNSLTNGVNRAGLHLPGPSYQKRVLREIVRSIEAAIQDPDEDEISDDLMTRLTDLTTLASYQKSPYELAKEKCVVTYTLPSTLHLSQAQHSHVPIEAGDHIFVEECPNVLAAEGTTSQRTWEASLHLATYLIACNNMVDDDSQPLVRGRSVLELGAGVGLLSLICAGPLSAAHVVATDGDEDVADKISRIIALNKHLSSSSPKRSLDAVNHHNQKPSEDLPLKARILQWTKSRSLLRQNLVANSSTTTTITKNDYHDNKKTPDSGLIPCDLILGADITYNQDSLGTLAATLAHLLDLYSPSAQALIAATIRNKDTFEAFVAACQQDCGLVVEIVDGFRCQPFPEQRGLFHACGETEAVTAVTAAAAEGEKEGGERESKRRKPAEDKSEEYRDPPIQIVRITKP